jgi:hypothetical protein
MPTPFNHKAVMPTPQHPALLKLPDMLITWSGMVFTKDYNSPPHLTSPHGSCWKCWWHSWERWKMLGPIRANGGNNQPRSTPPHRKNVSFTSTIFGPQASNSVAVTTSNLAKKNNLQIKSPKGLDRTTKSNPRFSHLCFHETSPKWRIEFTNLMFKFNPHLLSHASCNFNARLNHQKFVPFGWRVTLLDLKKTAWRGKSRKCLF